MIILDTSGLLALIDSSQERHPEAAAAMEGERGPYLLSPFILAELDYLLGRWVGFAAQLAFLKEVAAGAFRLEHFESGDIGLALRVVERYKDFKLGLADASVVILADRHQCSRILTLDERHFRALRGPKNRPFILLPSDA